MSFPGEKIRFAVVGCGQIGRRHAALIQKHPDAELAALCDILPADQWKTDDLKVPCYTSLDDLLAATSDLDVVNICTPNGLHAPQALQVLDMKKHVVIEKPMALTKSDAEKIIHRSIQVSRQVFCVMQNRYSPPAIWIKEVVDTGLLGEIYFVQVNCYWNRDRRYYTGTNWHGTADMDGGTLFTQFSHFVDMLYWLFGDITGIQARFYDFNHRHLTEFEDSGAVNFDFVRGGAGCLNYSTAVWDQNLESSLTIIAENGSVKIGGQYMNAVEYCRIKDYSMPELLPTNPGNDYGGYQGSAQNHHFLLDNVIGVLQGRSTITTNALEGLKVVEIIERIYSQK